MYLLPKTCFDCYRECYVCHIFISFKRLYNENRFTHTQTNYMTNSIIFFDSYWPFGVAEFRFYAFMLLFHCIVTESLYA